MTSPMTTPIDSLSLMRQAIANAATVRTATSPNPWVGAVAVTTGGEQFHGATSPPGGPHAEIVALDAAGRAATGSTLVTTLEPCSHIGRTAPCAEAIIERGVARVVFAIEDPDPNVAGTGAERLRRAGVHVESGVAADLVEEQLRPYLTHRTTGRPYVVLKLAATLDGRIAAPDGSSKWITGPEARADVHRLRAESDAILVGAGTVRSDDPSLTVRDAEGADPQRIVLGDVADGARVQPCRVHDGDLDDLLDDLGDDGVLQLMVEGGADVAGRFHRAGLVDRYVIYLAPKLLGGDDGLAMFAGAGTATMADVWTGRFVGTRQLGTDVRLDVEPA